MHNQDELLQRISEARKPAEPIEPTAEPEGESLDVTEVTDEVSEAEPEAIAEDSPDEIVEDVEPSDDAEELYVDLDGREISLKDIKEWEQGHLRQSDYTKKTQELAEKRKALEKEQSEFQAKAEALDTHIAELSVLVEDKAKNIDWDELREYDPSEYLKQKELQEKREQALEQAKASRYQMDSEQTQAKAQAELQRLLQHNPQWLDNGKETEAYKQDMSTVRSYLNALGLDEQAQQGILVSGHGQAYLDAAKYHAAKSSKADVVKKVKKAPLVTKPSGKGASAAITELERAKKAHAKSGSVETALRLRKAMQRAKSA